jgi:hypothetical protein
MKAASSMARPAKNPFAIFGLFGVHIDKFPRSQNRCGKQNGELSFLGHAGTPALGDDVQVRKTGKGSLLFVVPQIHEEFDRWWRMISKRPGWKTKQGSLFFQHIRPMRSNRAEKLGRNPYRIRTPLIQSWTPSDDFARNHSDLNRMFLPITRRGGPKSLPESLDNPVFFHGGTHSGF